ncbi:MAG: ribosome rescue protein RqcH [Halobacteriaceae archaeon]
MDVKTELTGVDLVALVGELQGYVGAVCDKAYLYDDDLVRLKLREYERGRVELLCEVGDVLRTHVARPEHVPAAPGRPPDFARKLRGRIAGANLARVDQHGFDRVLEFEFRREDGDTTVVVELFGDGNVVVLDEGGSVVASLETVRLSSRTVAPGSQYEFPAPREHPAEMDREAFAAAVRESDTDLVRTLATQLDFGGLWAEELCTRAGVEKVRDVADATDEEIDALHGAVERLFADLSEPSALDPRIYSEDGERVDVTPVPLEEHADLESEAFETFNAALDEYFTNLERGYEAAEEAGGEAAGGGPDLEAEIETHERIVNQQEGAIEEFAAEAEAERERAELLYAHYDLVDEVCATVREALDAGHSWAEIEERFATGAERGIAAAEAVEGVDPEAGELSLRLDDHTVPVDPTEGVEVNADRRYTAAKEVEGKREGAEAALAETRAELERLREERERAEAGEGAGGQAVEGAAGTGAGAGEGAAEAAVEESGESEPTDWLGMGHVPVRASEQWYERFRWFRTSEGYLVIGGRDADQNEEIVEKYADRYDRFFHAQAHGGPATVLKTSDPSEPSKDIDVPAADLEQAAQFAVTYSAVWKQGKYSGDVYMVSPEQVSKTPESGEFLSKGGFAVRGDRTYFEDTPVGCAVGITCEPETRVVGGPPDAVEPIAETSLRVEPGRYTQADVGKRIYREFRERFADTAFVRKVASPDRIQHFLPPGGSRIAEE